MCLIESFSFLVVIILEKASAKSIVLSPNSHLCLFAKQASLLQGDGAERGGRFGKYRVGEHKPALSNLPPNHSVVGVSENPPLVAHIGLFLEPRCRIDGKVCGV
jgi:hypothetical protein